VPLGSDSNRRSAPWTGSSAATVYGMVLAGHWRHQVAAHQVAGGGVKLAKALVIQLGGAHPRIQAKPPKRFAFIDVADAGADTLLQQQLPQGRCLQLAGPAEDLLEVERVDQDIRSRCATGCRASRTNSMTGAAKQTATTSSKRSTAVARRSGWRQRSPTW